MQLPSLLPLWVRHIQQSISITDKMRQFYTHRINSINRINAIHFMNAINVTRPMSTCRADELIVFFSALPRVFIFNLWVSSDSSPLFCGDLSSLSHSSLLGLPGVSASSGFSVLSLRCQGFPLGAALYQWGYLDTKILPHELLKK